MLANHLSHQFDSGIGLMAWGLGGHDWPSAYKDNGFKADFKTCWLCGEKIKDKKERLATSGCIPPSHFKCSRKYSAIELGSMDKTKLKN